MLGNAFLLAFRQIRRNPMRSLLTVLGIVIGVAAVITMVTIGNGATQAVRAEIESFGSNQLMLRPGQRMGPGRSRSPHLSLPTLRRLKVRSQASSPPPLRLRARRRLWRRVKTGPQA